MDIPISDFRAPHSPLSASAHSPMPLGGALAHEISHFYAWYLSWVATPHAQAKNFQYLSQIKRIAQVCFDGGNFLSDREERRALESLKHLKAGLYDGAIPQREIMEHLKLIIADLTTANYKARLIAHTTELEYHVCIYPPEHQPLETTEAVRQLLCTIITHISPILEERDALAIDQGIAHILHNLPTIPNIHEAILKAITGWLKHS